MSCEGAGRSTVILDAPTVARRSWCGRGRAGASPRLHSTCPTRARRRGQADPGARGHGAADGGRPRPAGEHRAAAGAAAGAGGGGAGRPRGAALHPAALAVQQGRWHHCNDPTPPLTPATLYEQAQVYSLPPQWMPNHLPRRREIWGREGDH